MTEKTHGGGSSIEPPYIQDPVVPSSLTWREAARQVGVSEPTLRRAMTEGGYRLLRIGRQYRVPVEELQRWRREHLIRATDVEKAVAAQADRLRGEGEATPADLPPEFTRPERRRA